MLRLLVAWAFALFLVAGPVSAQVSALQAQTFPADPELAAAAAFRNPSALLVKARLRGTIRVIVRLTVPLKSAEELSSDNFAAQQQSLRLTQDRVIRRAFGPALAQSGGSVTRFDAIPYLSIFVGAAELARLQADPEVADIREDEPLRASLLQSVPRINADDVWAAGFPGTGFTVAILDTGVDKTHPMLAGKVVAEACFSTEKASFRTISLCPGRVAESFEPGSGVNCRNVIGCDHGTHVAGIAAGATMPGSLETGVAKNSSLIAIQVFTRFTRVDDCFVGPPCVAAFWTDVIKGLEHVYDIRKSYKIAAVNLSLGGGYFYNFPCDFVQPAMTDAIKLLRSARIATVIASGNAAQDNTMTPPACISSAIAVGSTLDTADVVSDFSNHAVQVRLLAPGSDISSSVPGNAIGTKSGTSMATPHVAGAFALLRDVYGPATVDDIAAALECTGVPVTRGTVTRPRINVDAARRFLLNPPNTPSLFEFGSPDEAKRWRPMMGAYSVESGWYRARVAPNWKIAFLPNCNERFSASMRFRRIDTDADTPWNSGIFFKAQLNTHDKFFSGYFAGVNKYQGGQVFLNRLHNFNLRVLNGGFAHQLCTVQTPINFKLFNVLQVFSYGGRHRVFLNGAKMCDVFDETFGVGPVAVATYFPDPATGHSFDIDRFILTPLENLPTP